MDLYFQRHDGQAVTCEDFVAAMQDASGVDLTQFRRWYARAGTPRLKAEGRWDAATSRYTLTLTQSLAATAYEQRLAEAGMPIDEGPLHIPVAVGLVLPDGTDAPLRLAGENAPQGTTRVLSLTAATQTFVFEDIPAAPVASLLRDFSAPVQLDFEQTDAELAHLMAHDADAFNRWEAGQRLATRVLLAGIAAGGEGTGWIPEDFVAACGRVLDAGLTARPRARRRSPGPAGRAGAGRGGGRSRPDHRPRGDPPRPRQPAPPPRHASCAARFETVWSALAPAEPYAPDGAQVGRRALRNLCLGYLAESDDAYLRAAVLPRLLAQFEEGGNMTDVIAALSTLANLDLPERETALAAFYARWQDEALVVDKWLQVQATSRLPGTVARVRELMRHPAFDLKNPNKVYALVRSFCAANPRHFHAPDGSGYALAADVIIELQAINPQVASRLARSFDRWRQFDAVRQGHARAALERIRGLRGPGERRRRGHRQCLEVKPTTALLMQDRSRRKVCDGKTPNITRRRLLGAIAAAPLLWPALGRAQPARPATRAIPSSGEAMPLVGLGSWITFNVGNDRAARDASAEVMRAFFLAGGRLIDSSPMYGSSQEVIGYGLKKLGRPANLFAADKVWISDGDEGRAQIETSRRLLGHSALRPAAGAQPAVMAGASADAVRHEGGRPAALCGHHHLARPPP